MIKKYVPCFLGLTPEKIEGQIGVVKGEIICLSSPYALRLLKASILGTIPRLIKMERTFQERLSNPITTVSLEFFLVHQ